MLNRTKPMKPGKGFKQRAPAATTGVLRVTAAARKAPSIKVKAKKKQSGAATNAEKAHMGRVAAMGCCLCHFLNYGHSPAEVHHVRQRHGWGRSGHMATIPLCREHHTGQPGGIHDMGRAQFAAHYGISELELLERVSLQLGISEGKAVAPAEPSIKNPKGNILNAQMITLAEGSES